MDFLDLKSIKSIIQIHMECGYQIHEILEIHEIHELRSTILIIRNDDKLIIYYQFIIVSYD